MMSEIRINGILIIATRKKIKSLRLTIHKQDGKVTLSIPERMPDSIVMGWLETKLPFIEKHLREMSYTAPITCEYITGETHYYLGEAYQLTLIEGQHRSKVELLSTGSILLYVKHGSSVVERKMIMERWYSRQLMLMIENYVNIWEPILLVKVQHIAIRQMKTRWGSCSYRTGKIRFNLELVKRRPALIEYVVVHEMVHLLESSHGPKFKVLMTKYLPNWSLLRKELNRCQLGE